MKLALATLATVAVANDKKVPPRHPEQRLKKLGTFYDNFAVEMVEMGKMKQGQADRFATRMQNFVASMKSAFNRPNCGYYDADSEGHGGPDPNPEFRDDGKARNRRSNVDEPDFVDFDEADAREMCDEDSARFADYCCAVDADAYGPCAAKRSGKKSAYDRLSNNPELKWRQITTGTRKWAQRYINNCHGQRKNKLASKRAMKIYKTWDDKLFG